MERIRGLSVEAIDWLINGVNAQDGLIAGVFENNDQVCVLGSVGLREDHMENWPSNDDDDIVIQAKRLRLVCRDYYDGFSLTSQAETIARENDHFAGTPKERKEHMLDWLRKQRILQVEGIK